MSSRRFFARGTRFALATPHRAATRIGVKAFKQGGSAVDAAVAANAVLTVVYPHMCGIGGDLFAVICDGRTASAINGSGAAAMALKRDHIRRDLLSMPRHGPLSVSVPGTVAAWAELVHRYGRLPFSAAIEPAIAYAERGVPTARSLARAIHRDRDLLVADPGMRAVFMPAGRGLREGHLLRQTALGATLRAIAEEGPQGFYMGTIGGRFIAGLRALGSPLTTEDLLRHENEVVRPLGQRYHDVDVHVPPPNSQGFVLLEILACLEQSGVTPDHLGRDAGVIARIFALASRDRDRFLADWHREPVPVKELLSEQHIRHMIDQARSRGVSEAAGRTGSGDTVGVVACDEGGLWVSLNQSLYDAFGSGILEPQTGIIAQNRGSSFSLDAESPNRLEGGKRPSHTLMPVVVTKNNRPMIASATMGGSAHPQIHAELLMAMIDGGWDAFAAIRRPRWLVGGLEYGDGSYVVAEARVEGSVVTDLTRWGVTVQGVGAWDEEVGHAQAVARSDDGRLLAASDPRADGTAAGW